MANAAPVRESMLPGGDHPVIITVSSEGEFTYSPTHVRARKGDTVTFDALGKPFEVVFKNHSPGKRLYLAKNRHNLDDRTAARLTIEDHVPNGIYQYAAAVFDEDRGRVYLDSGCGDIGVES